MYLLLPTDASPNHESSDRRCLAEQIMESIQFAKAVSLTFPHTLDGIALAEEVARQDGESFSQM